MNTIELKSNFLFRIRKPKLTNKELIAINLTAEYMSIESEYQLFRILPLALSSKIERFVYNRRKRKLFPYIEQIRNKLSNAFNEFEDYFIADSMPLEICKLSRSYLSKICKEQLESCPDKDYCVSQGYNYYGYKLHAVYSVKGVLKSLDISPVSVHDIIFLKDIKFQLSDCILIGDRGY